RGQVHEHQHHLLQKRLIHRPNDRAYLAMGDAVFFPRCGNFQDETLQRVHHRSQGAGRAPHLCLQVQATEKLAERLRSHPSFEAEYKQGGHHQADQPGAAWLSFPKRRFRVAISAIHSLEMAMHTAFGYPDAIRQTPDALFAVFTNRVDYDNALAPQSHGVGPCSGGLLKSWMKSVPQSTRSTTGCPALGGSSF